MAVVERSNFQFTRANVRAVIHNDFVSVGGRRNGIVASDDFAPRHVVIIYFLFFFFRFFFSFFSFLFFSNNRLNEYVVTYTGKIKIKTKNTSTTAHEPFKRTERTFIFTG